VLAILVPVLDRPQNVLPLLESIHANTPAPVRVLWICDPGDIAEQDAIAREGGQMISPSGSYAAKIRAGVEATTESLLFLAADDIRFQAGWLEEAIRLMPAAQVVGVNDGIPRPQRPEHATHFLMTRAYAELPCIDGHPGPLFGGYSHWRVDDELIATAKKRGCYAYAPAAVVEHVGHPMQGGQDDDTYRKGRANARWDGKVFRRREHLWT
jgi:hypothetical protein